MRPMFRSAAIAMMALGLVVAAVPAANALTLTFTVDKQEQSQWCWAASAKSVIRYQRGTVHSQCTLVKKGFNSSTCPNNPGSFITQLDRIYAYAGVSGGSIVYQMPSHISIRYDIDRYQPQQIRYGYHSTSLSTGHIVAIHGYSGTSTVYWSDPASGTKKSGSHSYLSNNSTWKTTHGRYNM